MDQIKERKQREKNLDQIQELQQREKNLVFLSRLLALFADVVVKECAASPTAREQTDLVQVIKEDILKTMEKRLGQDFRCGGNKNCTPPRTCNEGVCM